METLLNSEIHEGDIVVSVSDEKPEPSRWKVTHVARGFVSAELIRDHKPGTIYVPVTAIYRTEKWKKV